MRTEVSPSSLGCCLLDSLLHYIYGQCVSLSVAAVEFIVANDQEAIELSCFTAALQLHAHQSHLLVATGKTTLERRAQERRAPKEKGGLGVLKGRSNHRWRWRRERETLGKKLPLLPRYISEPRSLSQAGNWSQNLLGFITRAVIGK